MHTTEGVWLSITDYSQYKGVSISTIRRHIKSNILNVKEDEGKYFIYVANSERVKIKEDEEILRLKFENEFLKKQLRESREEATGLRMLVDLYESQTTPEQNSTLVPPELPAYV